jgi:hypothetical protein
VTTPPATPVTTNVGDKIASKKRTCDFGRHLRNKLVIGFDTLDL